MLFAAAGVILTAGYMLWLLKRLFYGPEVAKWIGHLTDARTNEKVVAFALSVVIVGLGIYPLILIKQYNPVAESITNQIGSRFNISMR